MKKALICSVAALVILLAGGTALTKETGKNKEANKQAKGAAESVKPSAEQKQAKEQMKDMTPEQRRAALAKKALEEELAPWLAVRKIALEENATKTVAAIDKIVAGKQEQFKKKLEAKTEKPATTEKPSPENKRREAQRSEKSKQTKP